MSDQIDTNRTDNQQIGQQQDRGLGQGEQRQPDVDRTDTHHTDTGIGGGSDRNDERATLDRDTSVLGQDDTDTGGLTQGGDAQSTLPGYGDQGQGGAPTRGQQDAEIARRPSQGDDVETGMGRMGGAGASGSGPDLGRSGSNT